ncbi:unnamed protein product [marine sediment metagenome]|uniref:Uncharacterized protein n=1 Tax=marine sediment metagenome TaxID=412755 RepID=X1L048_9ZZZZ
MAPSILGKWLEGKKTYIMIVATLCYALGGWVAGFVEPQIAIGLILGVLGLGGLKSGIERLLGIDKLETTPPVPSSASTTSFQ